jgi:hypothetical protein
METKVDNSNTNYESSLYSVLTIINGTNSTSYDNSGCGSGCGGG